MTGARAQRVDDVPGDAAEQRVGVYWAHLAERAGAEQEESGGRMFEPMRTGDFGVSGHLVMAGTLEIDEADYWYHTPYFWLVEENGEAIFREGSRNQDIGGGDPAGALRMLSKPVFFADNLGLRIEWEGTATTHHITGRPVTEVSARGSHAGSAAIGKMVIDNETAIVLSVTMPVSPEPDRLIRLETTQFAVHDTMDAELFGAETLDSRGYYSASYYRRLDKPNLEAGL